MPKVLPIPTGGSRNGRGRRVSTTLAEINVIPLVDVMLVLLIIFMVTAPMLQRGVEVQLPVASRAQDIASERRRFGSSSSRSACGSDSSRALTSTSSCAWTAGSPSSTSST